MIPYIDVAMVGFVRKLFVNDPGLVQPVVYWGPPEASRQSLAIGEQQSSAGVPGVSIFRTGMDFYKNNFNMPAATTPGYPVANNTDGRTANRMQAIPVIAEYTAVGWASALSDLNDIEREMWFSTRYKTVQATIQENPFRFYVSVQNPSYRQNINDNTGKVVWYEITQKYLVSAFWIHSTNIPLVKSIDVDFYDRVTSGDPLPGNLIDQIVINVDTKVPKSP